MNQFLRTLRRPPPAAPLSLDRKAFYDLAVECRTYAAELANYDQHRVNLKQCHRFNAWLAYVKRYDKLGPRIATLSAARPVARWQIITLMVAVWVLMALALPGRVSQQWMTLLIGSWLLTIVVVFFIPEAFYGTTTELLEAKVLRVVDSLLDILNSGSMEFTEAAFFRVRENLQAAREELRMQIDLAHRSPNGPIF
ncbi:MAG: hypothetical protein R6W76_06210 [Caldilinea sp.]